ncbi:unnamed protein product [Fusarium venenatum]|uniref:Uncharacterized protein n=1 Tax=Fusarium venenatum TaxID=56646 RepID=A0A2L2TY47_9HYPO|nr:uncharacterized protein FVRRES_03492 [Fusarium venenatum]CEI66980.1 unnamed protein product [Fusarium venenatum]
MFNYRGRGGPSRSTPANVQSTAQERPYVSRPSRSQQLRNPKLVPKLTNETLNPLEKKEVLRGLRRLVEIELDHLVHEEEVLILTTHEAEVTFEAEVEVLARIAAEAPVSSLNAGNLCLAMIVLQKTMITVITIDLAILCLQVEKLRLRSNREETCQGHGVQMDTKASVPKVQGRRGPEEDMVRGLVRPILDMTVRGQHHAEDLMERKTATEAVITRMPESEV